MLFCVSLALLAMGQDARALDVFYAGLAFQGKAEEVPQRYPYLYKLSQKKTEPGARISDFSATLIAAARSVKTPGYKLLFDEKGDLDNKTRKGQSLALVVDREAITVEKRARGYQITFAIDAQVLVFDYVRKTVTASFPIYHGTRHFSLEAPTDQEKMLGIHRTLLGGDGDNSTSLLKEFTTALSEHEIRSDYKKHVGVSQVGVADEARKWLPQWANDDLPAFKASLAGIFSRWLSKNQNLSVVPYQKDGAIGGTMTAVFVNGDAANFELPKKTYVIDLNLKEFKKILLEEQSYALKYLYGAYLDVKGGLNHAAKKPDMNITFKQGLERVIPADRKGLEDDWLIFHEVLDQMAYGITSELKAKPDKKWLKSHTRNKNAAKEIKEFSKSLENCR